MQYDTSSKDLYNLPKSQSFDKISERLQSLNERYFENIKLACEYRTGFLTRIIEYKIVLCCPIY